MKWLAERWERFRTRTKRKEKKEALLLLREALILENYENCDQLIETASRKGAESSEIRKVLLDYCPRIESHPEKECTLTSLKGSEK